MGQQLSFDLNQCIQDSLDNQISCKSGCCSCDYKGTDDSELLIQSRILQALEDSTDSIDYIEPERIDNNNKLTQQNIIKNNSLSVDKPNRIYNNNA